MEEGKFYVLAVGNNLFEGLTKEQVIALIAEATGATPTHVDDAFITKLKEQNRNTNLKLWVGTHAEYNAIETYDHDTLYIVTDENEVDELEMRMTQAESAIETLSENAVIEQGTIDDASGNVWNYRKWADGTAECWVPSITTNPSYIRDNGGFIGSVNFPENFFLANTLTTTVISGSLVNVMDFDYCVITVFASSDEAISFSGLTNMQGLSTNDDINLSVYAIGRWQ